MAQEGCELGGGLQRLALAVEPELSGGVELEQSGAELALKHLGDGLHREEPAGLFGSGPGVLRGESAPGDQAMQMGMVHEVLAPGMEDGRDAQLSSEPLVAELEQGRAGTVQEEAVNLRWVLQSQRSQRRRQSEHPVKVAYRQERATLAL